MDLDFDYFSMVLAGVVRAITDDQMILEHQLNQANTKIDSKLIIRNRYTTNILGQLIYLGQNLTDASIQAIGLLEVLNKVDQGFSDEQIKTTINRDKPFVDVLADPKSLIAILRIVFCLMKGENLNNKKFKVDLRRRDGYVSVRIESGKIKSEPGYLKDVLGFMNYTLQPLGGSIHWISRSSIRVAFIRLRLSSQMPLGYNE